MEGADGNAGAVYFFFWQSVKGRGNLFISQRQHFFEFFSLCHLGGQGRSGNGCPAALDPELHIGKDVVLDFEKEEEGVAATRLANLNDYIGIVNHSYVPGILEMFHYLVGIQAALLLSVVLFPVMQPHLFL